MLLGAEDIIRAALQRPQLQQRAHRVDVRPRAQPTSHCQKHLLALARIGFGLGDEDHSAAGNKVHVLPPHPHQLGRAQQARTAH